VSRFREGVYSLEEMRRWSIVVFGVDLTEGL